jgi:hypothetical protein
MGSQSQQSKRAYRKRQKKQKKLKKRQAVKESSSGCSNSSSENCSQSSSSVTNPFELSSNSDNSSAPSGQLNKHHSTKKDTMTVIYNDPLYIKMIEYRMHRRRISQLVNQKY